MFLQINPSSNIPIYYQLMEQIKKTIITGEIKPGDPIPSVRDLASSLKINPLTVQRAYQELKREGTIEVQRGVGYHITDKVKQATSDEKQKIILEKIDACVTESLRIGLTKTEFIKLIENRIKYFKEKK